MPTVSALVWKNMMMHPVYGLFAWIATLARRCTPIDWFADYPLLVDHPDRRLAVAAVRHADPAHRAAVARRGAEGSGRDGRRQRALDRSSTSRCRTSRAPITVVILIETIFLLGVFAEIFVTTGGGPGYASTNLAFLIYPAGAARVRRRRRLGRRPRRGRPRQHRRLLPDPHGRQEPGR